MKIIIRDYKKSDKKALAQCCLALGNCLIPLNPLRRKKILPEFLEIYPRSILRKIKNGKGKILIAEVKEKIIGLIIGFLDNQSKKELLEFIPIKVGKIVELFVHSKYRKKGVGTLLIKRMENFFRHADCKIVRIDVLAANRKVYDLLYKKLHYKNYSMEMIKRI